MTVNLFTDEAHYLLLFLSMSFKQVLTMVRAQVLGILLSPLIT